MTPDAAFGYQRAGTHEALAALGAARGFEVVVVPAFEVDGRPVSSTQIRADIAAGNLEAAARQLGRPHAVVGEAVGEGEGSVLRFPLPVALPPEARYRARIGAGSSDERGSPVTEADVMVQDGSVVLPGVLRIGRTKVEFEGPA